MQRAMPPRRRPSGSPVGSASPEERSATLATAKGDATPTEPPSYVACEAFDGAREGYEFKNGINGVGYYRTGSGPEEKAESETVAGDAVPAPEPAPATKWRDPDDANFDIESVPAMTPEEIKVAEDKERERVTRISAVRLHPSCYVPPPPASLLTVCSGHDDRSWRARCRTRRSSAQYLSSLMLTRTGGWI